MYRPNAEPLENRFKDGYREGSGGEYSHADGPSFQRTGGCVGRPTMANMSGLIPSIAGAGATPPMPSAGCAATIGTSHIREYVTIDGNGSSTQCCEILWAAARPVPAAHQENPRAAAEETSRMPKLVNISVCAQ